MKCLILAGGSGTRFWPYSRYERPKQLLNIIGDQSMLQMTVDRLKKIKKVTDIYIITRNDLRDSIIDEVTGIEPENVIVEPSGKNTAPAIGIIGAFLNLIEPDSVMGVFPADHIIVGHRKFQKAVYTADRIAKKDENLVTIGIKPTKPSTAYGYIQMNEISEEDYLDAYRVKTFAEKPHKELAKRFIASGDFLWNSGIFFWRVSTLMKSLEKHMPELFEVLNGIGKKMQKGIQFNDLWNYVEPESIDYGLLEKADNIYVVSSDFSWNDVGSWNALYDVLRQDKEGNIVRGQGKVMGGQNNFIQSNGRFTAVLGASDLIVINTDDATLVVPRDQVEDVKALVEFLKKNKKDHLI